MLSLRHSNASFKSQTAQSSSFALRLLNAAHCANATHSGLSEALRHLPSLLYLDLSHTLAARHSEVLSSLNDLKELQILKLRGLGLRDKDIEILARSIGLHVRSLDLRSNSLTDTSAQTLSSRCFRLHHTDLQSAGLNDCSRLPFHVPASRAADTLYKYQGERLDSYVRKRLVSAFVGRLAIEDDPEPGITHLYVSDNCLTVEGVSELLGSGCLRVFDVGNLSTSPGARHGVGGSMDGTLQGAEKLVRALASPSSASLRFLRINHSIVTSSFPKANITSGPSERPNEHSRASSVCAVKHNSNAVAESRVLGSNTFPRTPEYTREVDPAPAYEMSTPQRNPAEFDVKHISPSSDFTNDTGSTPKGQGFEIRRDSRIAPAGLDNNESALNATSSCRLSKEDPNGVDVENGEHFKKPNKGAHKRSFSGVRQERQTVSFKQSPIANSLVPRMLPRLKTLVLTGLPEYAPNQSISNGVIEFVKECARENSLSHKEASLSYLCPPGRNKRAFEIDYAMSIFALSLIVLEMADPVQSERNASQGWRFESTTKSSTEDPDSEALWSAAENDFSFFHEEAEAGQYVKQRSTAWGCVMVPHSKQDRPLVENTTQKKQQDPDRNNLRTINVVAEISKFRQDRKARQASISRTERDATLVDGFWDGEMQVVRPYINEVTPGSSQDYYGNKIERQYRPR